MLDMIIFLLKYNPGILIVLLTIAITGCSNGVSPKGKIYSSCIGRIPHSIQENQSDLGILGNYSENPNNPDITRTIVMSTTSSLKKIGIQCKENGNYGDVPNKDFLSVDKIDTIAKNYTPSKVKYIAGGTKSYQEVMVEFKFGKPFIFSYDSSHPVYGMTSSGGVSTVTSNSSLNYGGYLNNPYYQPSITTTGSVVTPPQFGAIGYVSSRGKATGYPYMLCISSRTTKGDSIRIMLTTVTIESNYKKVIPAMINAAFKFWGSNTPTLTEIVMPIN